MSINPTDASSHTGFTIHPAGAARRRISNQAGVGARAVEPDLREPFDVRNIVADAPV
jgi:hypothetical protein